MVEIDYKGFKLKPIFAGLQKFTTNDFFDKMGATIFTGGCNFRCKFCHNPNLVLAPIKFISVKEVVDFLEKRVGFLDAITFCGGEPTVHQNLIEWIRFVKFLGYKVKLDTNATNSSMISFLIKENLVDFFAIDFKAPIEKYKKVVDVNFLDFSCVLENIRLIVLSNVDYDIRTTVHSDLLSFEDILEMIEQLRKVGVLNYHLQSFRMPPKTLGVLSNKDNSSDTLKRLEPILKKYFKNSGIRNVD